MHPVNFQFLVLRSHGVCEPKGTIRLQLGQHLVLAPCAFHWGQSDLYHYHFLTLSYHIFVVNYKVGFLFILKFLHHLAVHVYESEHCQAFKLKVLVQVMSCFRVYTDWTESCCTATTVLQHGWSWCHVWLHWLLMVWESQKYYSTVSFHQGVGF